MWRLHPALLFLATYRQFNVTFSNIRENEAGRRLNSSVMLAWTSSMMSNRIWVNASGNSTLALSTDEHLERRKCFFQAHLCVLCHRSRVHGRTYSLDQVHPSKSARHDRDERPTPYLRKMQWAHDNGDIGHSNPSLTHLTTQLAKPAEVFSE